MFPAYKSKPMNSITAKLLLVLLFVTATVRAQSIRATADSIRRHYHIPELAYAVVQADTVLTMEVLGFKRQGSAAPAALLDRFHIGSNTKAITAFIAARLVAQQRISWKTTFFSLFPELKKTNKDFTLEDLLSFRAALPPYTYTVQKPLREQITGDEQQQRYALVQYLLPQKAAPADNGIYLTNTGYILAGLMLEKATGKHYKALVQGIGTELNMDFGFGYPNNSDTLQTWGHDVQGTPVAPSDNYKLDWLLSAGNINVTLPDYIKWIQELLKDKPRLLSRADTDHLLYGRAYFAFGWFNEKNKNGAYTLAANEGNAGAFITKVQIRKQSRTAYVIFCNAATAAADEGTELLMEVLQGK